MRPVKTPSALLLVDVIALYRGPAGPRRERSRCVVWNVYGEGVQVRPDLIWRCPCCGRIRAEACKTGT